MAAKYLEIDEKVIVESVNKYAKEEDKHKKIVCTERAGWLDLKND